MKLSKLMPVDWVEWVTIAVVVIFAGWFYVAFMGWPAWVPWSAEKKLPVVEAKLEHTEDVLEGARTQAQIVAQAQTRNQYARDLATIIEVMTDANVAQDLDREDPALGGSGAWIERLCGYDSLYAADPACQGGDQPGSPPPL
jgi:hypothetical protein